MEDAVKFFVKDGYYYYKDSRGDLWRQYSNDVRAFCQQSTLLNKLLVEISKEEFIIGILQ